jgi:hypothetical protein
MTEAAFGLRMLRFGLDLTRMNLGRSGVTVTWKAKANELSCEWAWRYGMPDPQAPSSWRTRSANLKPKP